MILLALTGSLALALPPVPTVVLPPAPVVPIHLRVDDALGPPTTTCSQELAQRKQASSARGSSWRPPGVPPVPRSPRAGMAVQSGEPAAVVANEPVSWSDVKGGLLPGARPDELPLQPLEGDYESLRNIGDVMRRASVGDAVRMSVFGASHTGGDFFTGELRRNLQARHGDRGHGFVFPAALYDGHRAHDINLCSSPGWRSDWVGRKNSRWDGLHGFSGASVSTSDPLDFAWIETTRESPHGRSWDRVQLWALGQPGGGSLEITIDEADPIVVSTLRPRAELVHIVLDLPDGPHRARVRSQGDGEVRLFGITGERSTSGVLVDAIGIRGRTARTWIDWASELRDPGLQALDTDLIVLAYGTNEAADTDYAMWRYREELRQVLGIVRTNLPSAACILVGPSDRATVIAKGKKYAVWGRTALVAQVQREVAPEFGCAFWDWQMAQGGPGAMLSWRAVDPPLAGWDYIHFTQAGYERSAALFLAALDDATAVTGGVP